MQARDVMQSNVVTVLPDTSVREVAERLLAHHISAVPVVDDTGRLLGIVSEGDLMRRPESGTERRSSWWLSLLADPEERALAYVKSHGGRAKDVMSRDLVSVQEETSLEQVAERLERYRIKRVPVLRNGKLVGIVSRADLLRGLVARQAGVRPSADDRALRTAIEAALREAGLKLEFLNIVVSGGVVHLWGAVESTAEKRAAVVAVESLPGIKGIRDEVGILPPMAPAVMWAD